ncbi:hypothetical protein [Microbacterium sp. SSM24]|uniref:hypothetical protein n=1 Tax=Microbacterium sp. SSM24 TaxID=2991714 RepID=UPI002225CFB0|nr:hypothetical protein [Microbacterium sp. SSM24]MCW3491886.1 hypothetical protein [Microbacterium sp. SSM24]
MSAYDLFALHLMERETLHVDLERRRRVLEHVSRSRKAEPDAAPAASASATSQRGSVRRRLLPGGA